MATPENNPDDIRPDAILIGQLQENFGGTGAIISIAGPDGAGKTTLANQLVDAFTEAGLPVKRIHCYAWYKNLFVMPFRLARLKNQGEIIILDRSIFDNVIELARKAHLPKAILRIMLYGVSTIHSRFDHRIVLWAPLQSLISRRPEEHHEKLERTRVLYSVLTGSADYKYIEANGPILRDVLQIILCPKVTPPSGSTHDQ